MRFWMEVGLTTETEVLPEGLDSSLRGDKELKSFDLHPGDYIAVF
jgi:hypothetical protein